MYTSVEPKREEIKLCELNPGDTFICPEFDDGVILMVIKSESNDEDINISFEEGKVIGVDLDEGDLWSFYPDTLVYKVSGRFEGSY